jgi:hypothetical protein
VVTEGVTVYVPPLDVDVNKVPPVGASYQLIPVPEPVVALKSALEPIQIPDGEAEAAGIDLLLP